MKRDKDIQNKLGKSGWKVLTIWECEIREIEKTTELLDSLLKNPHM